MPNLEQFRRLTDVEWRKSFEAEHGIFIAEGFLTIERALTAGLKPLLVLSSAKFEAPLRELMPLTEFEILDDSSIASITGYHVHRGALAAFERPRSLTLDELPKVNRVAVLDDLVDHENVGTIMRSAAALGVDAVVLTQTCADPLYRRSIKTSMGAVFSVPWFRGGSALEVVHTLRERGFTQWALTPGATEMLEGTGHRDERLAMWLGNEGEGLPQAIMSAVDRRISISMMRDVDSINVAAAAAIAFWATRTASPDEKQKLDNSEGMSCDS